jgi:hypothetical protein
VTHFPGTGMQDNLADNVKKLGIPVWTFGGAQAPPPLPQPPTARCCTALLSTTQITARQARTQRRHRRSNLPSAARSAALSLAKAISMGLKSGL